MKRLAVVLMLVFAACSPAAPRSSSTSTSVHPGVPAGTAVVARFNPTNNIVVAVDDGAKAADLGQVDAVGFHPDCSSVQNAVVVCRNASYTKGQTSTQATATTCVVQLDPKLGGSSRGVKRVTEALKACRP